jgi:hypothetical protein
MTTRDFLRVFMSRPSGDRLQTSWTGPSPGAAPGGTASGGCGICGQGTKDARAGDRVRSWPLEVGTPLEVHVDIIYFVKLLFVLAAWAKTLIPATSDWPLDP